MLNVRFSQIITQIKSIGLVIMFLRSVTLEWSPFPKSFLFLFCNLDTMQKPSKLSSVMDCISDFSVSFLWMPFKLMEKQFFSYKLEALSRRLWCNFGNNASRRYTVFGYLAVSFLIAVRLLSRILVGIAFNLSFVKLPIHLRSNCLLLGLKQLFNYRLPSGNCSNLAISSSFIN